MEIDSGLATFDCADGEWPVSHCQVKGEIVDGRLRSWNRYFTGPLNAEIAETDWTPWILTADELFELPS